MNSRDKKYSIAILSIALFGLGGVSEASNHLLTSGSCVDTVSGTANNCTANDVTFVLVGLGTVSDPCVNVGDMVTMLLGARLQNTTAQTRYDIGMYISLNGQSAKTGTSCARAALSPVGGTGVTTCGSGPGQLDLLRQFDNYAPAGIDNGPFLSAETGASNSTPDQCGDLFAQGNSGCDQDGNGLWDDSFIEFTEPITFSCQDINSDGFVNIPTCATWGQQANEVNGGNNSTCDGAAEVVPGTPAKCRCESVNSTLPVANLFCSANGTQATQGSISCAIQNDDGDGVLDPGETTRCTVHYDNTITCAPDPSTPEREQCGTLGYVFFEVAYNDARGGVSSLNAANGTATDSSGVIRFVPTSVNSTPGIIGPGRSGSLTFDYTLDIGETSTADLSFTLTSRFSNNPSPFSPSSPMSAPTCSTTVQTVPVTVAWVASQREGDGAELRWSTATETGNVGFNVYVEDERGWRKVNDELISSEVGDSIEPTEYSLELAGVSAGRFIVEDVDARGKTRRHGPFELGASHGRATSTPVIDWTEVREGLEPRGRMRAAVAAAKKEAVGAGQSGVGSDLRLRESGLYRVSYDDLVAAGLDPSKVRLDNLALSNRGASVPLEAVGSRTFGPGSYIQFYGEEIDSFYQAANVYRLVDNRKTALRMTVEDATPAGGEETDWYAAVVKLDDDRAYSVSAPADPWYLAFINAGTTPRSASFLIGAPGLRSVPGTNASVAVVVGGGSDLPPAPDHHVRVKVNGTTVAEATFDGAEVSRIEGIVPDGVLAASNTIVVEVAADLGLAFDRVFVESVELRYPRSLEMAGPQLRFAAAGSQLEVTGVGTAAPLIYRLGSGGPVRLVGAQVSGGVLRFRGRLEVAEYLVVDGGAPPPAPEVSVSRPPADLGGEPADLLVVSHGAFIDGLGPLVAQRQSQGLSVRVVDVADVYDQYNHGIVDASAIRDYVRDAAGQGVRYVLLVGGDTYDYGDVLGLGSVSLVPSLYASTNELVEWAPVDPLFGDVDGDAVPDVAVGRLPVRSSAELGLVVGKILEYEARTELGTGVFAADGSPAGEVPFGQDSDRMIAQLGDAWQSTRAYVDSLGFAPARTLLLDELDAGRALASFVGHSGPTFWSFGGLLTASDVATLDNAGSPSVVVQWGCWNTFHVAPRFDTLGHRFLLAGPQGAAAVLGASTLLDTTSARALSWPLMGALSSGPVAIGDAVLAAKRQLVVDGTATADVILGWSLLGDPAMRVAP